ncbi:methylated-DNA--[protein]-cysteine S-methyltransferase [Nocardia sp. NPDC051030]|uniref:methylated-DNA--[protein]-cysteine S-methyltransferase n=1 Tax=Nocardia sp. NPDC051030 TaxID=3155162 RepID=UPI00341F79B6
MSTESATATATFTTLTTPAGPFTAIVDADNAVLASGWTADPEDLRGVIHSTLRPTTLQWRDSLGPVSEAIEAYHEGDLTVIDAITVRQVSGPFLMHAWETLRKVPAGEPITYTDYAGLSGRPAATRAAANACARNAAALFVPCHRVFRTDGTLGGFRWGLPIKRWLLDHEANQPS